MKNILTLILTFISIYCHAQQNDKFNLGFEEKKANAALATGWFKWGTYNLSVDSLNHSGNLAAKITSDEAGSSFGSIAYSIPANYSGKTIKLEGYIKIKDVEGFAGLLLRIDGDGKSLVFDNMQNQQVKGTKDWQKYSVTLDYPEDGELILVAGMLSGKGEAWFDDFVVTIDGQDIQTLQEIEKQLPKPQTDKEFDNGSTINLSKLSPKQLDNLELLGRIWGFLKYHHPEIAKGNYNWDYELFRFLPKYIDANIDTQRDDLLVSWIYSLGEVKACQPCLEAPSETHLKPDFSWIERQHDKLRTALLHVYINRTGDEHYYIGMAAGVGNPLFKNEQAYAKMSYPDDGFRLLSLYRYWNMINYFFPYKYLTDKNWDTTLKEYLPVFIQAKDELAYELAVLQIIAEVNDTHAGLGQGADKIAAWKGINYPTFQTRFIEDKLTVTYLYYPELQESTGLAVGDVIHSIDGKKIGDIITERSRYYPASNKPAQLRNMAYDLLRSDKESIEIEFTSANGAKQTKVLTLYPGDSLRTYTRINPKPPESFKMLDDNIGYITLQTIKSEDITHIKKDFGQAKGIIIDIRNYPATFVPFTLGSYFISGSSPFVKFTTGSLDHPGFFTLSDNLKITNKQKHYKGPVVVLVNELSISQSEYTAMAFRAGTNTTIMGSTTAGADGNVSEIWLPGGLRTAISGVGIYYPDGTETQRVGIIPDIEVKPTVEGIRNGKDELLEQAIEFIKRK